jgi:hypothetical protein
VLAFGPASLSQNSWARPQARTRFHLVPLAVSSMTTPRS